MLKANKTQAAAVRGEWRTHWRSVIGAGICIATGYGVYPFVASQFVEPLHLAFGWIRSQQSLVQNIALAAAFLAPVCGRAVDRYCVRSIGLGSMVGLALCYGLLATMHGPIYVFYVLAGATLVIGLGTTVIVFMRAVSSRFEHSLGLALAVARCGVALSAAILPVLLYQVINRFSWRGGYLLLAGLVALVGIPACVVWIAKDERGPGGRTAEESWATFLSDRKVFSLCFAVALAMGPVVGILSQLQPLLIGKGVGGKTAAGLGSVLAVSVLVGTALTGWLLDHVWAPLIGCVFLVACATGCVCLMPAWLLVMRALCGVAFIGITQGAELDLAGYIIARYFGIANYAAIFGLSILSIGIALAIAQMGFAFIFDRTGAYSLALQLSVLAFALSAIAFLSLGRYPSRAVYAGENS